MGMLSKAMKPSRFCMTLQELNLLRAQEQAIMARNSPPLQDKRYRTKLEKDLDITHSRVVIDPELVPDLQRMAEERDISITQLINIRLRGIIGAYNGRRTLGLNDPMPYGQYKGVNMEQLIRADTRYVRWLYSTSEIFELDDDARLLLEELS